MTNMPWGTLQQEMAAAVAESGELHDIADVADQLLGIQRVLELLPAPRCGNPIADFNRLYVTITMQMLRSEQEGSFADRDFLNLLGVEFARCYIDALRGWVAASSATPQAWSILFWDYDYDATPLLPYTVAGANAHINLELPFAIAATWDKLGFMPVDSVQYRDYLRLSEIISDTVLSSCVEYQSALQQRVGSSMPQFAEAYQWVLLQLTRDLAWDRARQFWMLYDDPPAMNRFRSGLDEVTTLTGRALLLPAL